MRERCNPTRGVDPIKYLLGRRADTRHKSSATANQPAVKRLADVRDMPSVDECARDPGSANRFGRIREGRCENGLHVEDDAVSDEFCDHLADALHSPLALI